MKGMGAIIAGVIFSVAGLGLIAVCAKPAYDDYKKMDNFKTGTIELNDSKTLNVECDAGTVTIHHTTSTKSYVEYNVSEFFNVKYDKEDNEVKLTRKWQYWFIFFTNKKNTMDVYLTDTDYDMFLELNAGDFILDGDYEFNNLSIEVNAGDFNSNGKLIVKEEAKLRVNAGDLNVAELEAKKTTLKVNAGDLIVDKLTSDDITFNVNAGDLKFTVKGKLDDYNTDINRNAGSINLDKEYRNQKVVGSEKNIKGKINAGSVKVYFEE
ncbi:MAG: DUF4097 family beta strand repeat protein [Acholeplasmatales bacterium]|nr:DUF4097 family beta strand repeat protein [Acholeplasmatales bacterium]